MLYISSLNSQKRLLVNKAERRLKIASKMPEEQFSIATSWMDRCNTYYIAHIHVLCHDLTSSLFTAATVSSFCLYQSQFRQKKKTIFTAYTQHLINCFLLEFSLQHSRNNLRNYDWKHLKINSLYKLIRNKNIKIYAAQR